MQQNVQCPKHPRVPTRNAAGIPQRSALRGCLEILLRKKNAEGPQRDEQSKQRADHEMGIVDV